MEPWLGTQMQIGLEIVMTDTLPLVIYFKGPVSWISKKQPVIALSTSEAEYIAVSAAAQEVVWLRRLLEDKTY